MKLTAIHYFNNDLMKATMSATESMCLVPTVLMFKVKETASEMIRSEAD
jgi:hypothetical protein